MAILRERKTWRREPSEMAQCRRLGLLTAEEQANVRRAIRALRIRFGSNDRLAKAMGMTSAALERASTPSRAQSARLAMLVSRIAGVPVGEVLSGVWPVEGVCLMCWR